MSVLTNDTVTNVAEIVSRNAIPTSFNGDAMLFGLNLFAMTAFTLLGVMFAGWMASSIFVHRAIDKPFHPVTIFRTAFLCAGIALTLRSGGEAASLWAWDPASARTAEDVLVVKRYLDPIALAFAAGWLTLVTLAYPAMVQQLRKRPFPIEMLSRLPSLKRPAAVVGMSFVAAVLIAWLK